MARSNMEFVVSLTSDQSSIKRTSKEISDALNAVIKMPNRSQNLITQSMTEASKAAKELGTYLEKSMNMKTGQVNLTKFNEQLRLSGHTANDYAESLNAIGSEGRKAFLEITKAVSNAEIPLKRSNDLFDKLWKTMKTTVIWQFSNSLINTFTGGIQRAYGFSKDLNRSLTEIQIVTQKSSAAMADLSKNANIAAKTLSTDTANYTDAQLIYYQQGLTDKEVIERTNATIQLAKVSRQSAEEASSQVTAIWNNFADGTKDLKYYIDVMTALGAATASSSEQISSGLQKFAPVANTVGLSYEYAAAALATLVDKTQESEDVVGTSLRTLFARIQGLQQGEEQDDGTTLNKYSQALANIGVNIKDANGNLRDMDNILDELGEKWQDLERDEKFALAQTVGGVRQYSQLFALMENWEAFKGNIKIAEESEGSLNRQFEIYANSWEAAEDRVRAAAEDIYDSLINPEFFVELDNVLTPVLTTIADLIDAFGGFPGLLANASFWLSKLFAPQIAQTAKNMVYNIKQATGIEQKDQRKLKEDFTDAAARMFDDVAGTPDEIAQMDLLQADNERIILLNRLNAASDKLTDQQQEQLKYEIELLTQARKITIERERQATLAAEALENSRNSLLEINEEDEIGNTRVITFNEGTRGNSRQVINNYRALQDENNFEVRGLLGQTFSTRGIIDTSNTLTEEEIQLQIRDAIQDFETSNPNRRALTQADQERLEQIVRQAQEEYSYRASELIEAMLEGGKTLGAFNAINNVLSQQSNRNVNFNESDIAGLLRNRFDRFINLNPELNYTENGLYSEINFDNLFNINENTTIEQLEEAVQRYIQYYNERINNIRDLLNQDEHRHTGLQRTGNALENAQRAGNAEFMMDSDAAMAQNRANIEALNEAINDPSAELREWPDLINTATEDLSTFFQLSNSVNEVWDSIAENKDIGNIFKTISVSALSSIGPAIASINNFTKSMNEASGVNRNFFENLKAGPSIIKNVINAMNAGSMAASDLSNVFAAISGTFGLFSMIAGIVGPIIGKLIDEWIVSGEEAIEYSRVASEKFNEFTNSVKATEDQLKSLDEQIQAIIDKDELSITDKEDLQRLREERIEIEQQNRLLEAQKKQEVDKFIAEDKRSGDILGREAQLINYTFSANFGDEKTEYTLSELREEQVKYKEQLEETNAVLEKQQGIVDETYNAYMTALSEYNKAQDNGEGIEEAFRNYKEALDIHNQAKKQLKQTKGEVSQLSYYYNAATNFADGLQDSVDKQLEDTTEAYEQLKQKVKDLITVLEYDFDNLDAQVAYSERLAELINRRKSELYGSEEQYFNIYIAPVLDDSSLTKYQDQLLNAARNIGEIAEDATQSEILEQFFNLKGEDAINLMLELGRSGTHVKDVISSISGELVRMSEQLSRIYHSTINIYDISSEEFEIFSKIDLKSITGGVDELYKKIARLVVKTQDWSIALNEGREIAKTALDTLSEGKFLDDETLTKLQEIFDGSFGMYNLNNIENLSSYEQALAIGEAYQSLADLSKPIEETTNWLRASNDELIKVQNRINEIKNSDLYKNSRQTIHDNNVIQELKELEKELDNLYSQEGFIQVNIEDARKRLEVLNNFELDPYEVKLIGVETVIAQMKQVEKGSTLIGEGFKVAAKDVADLVKILPEVFEGQIQILEDGTVQLEQAIVDKVSDSIATIAQERNKSMIELLENEIANTRTRIGLIDTVTEAVKTGNTEQLISENNKNNLTQEQAHEVLKSIILAKIQETSAAAQSNSNQIDYLNQLTDASYDESIHFTNNYKKAYDNILASAAEMFNEVKAAIDDPTRGISKVVTSGLNTSGMTKHTSNFVYRSTKIDDSLEKAANWIENGNLDVENPENYDKEQLLEYLKTQKEGKASAAQNVADTIKGLFPGLDLNYKSVLNNDWKGILGNFLNLKNINDILESARSGEVKNLADDIDLYSRLKAADDAVNKMRNSGLGKGSSGSSKNSKEEKLEEKKDLKNIEDRYHEINREIERQNDLIDDVNNNIERTYGKDKINNFHKQLVALTKQQENYNKKLAEAQERYLPQDIARLQELFTNVTIKDNGELANYEDLLNQTLQNYNNFLDGYNAYIISYNALSAQEQETAEATLKSWKEAKEAADLQYQTRLDALKQYETTRDVIQEIKDNIEENARKMADLQLQEIEYKLEIVLDVKGMKDGLRDLEKEIAEIFGDALTHGLQSAKLDYDTAQAEADMLPHYQQQFDELKALYESANDAVDRDRIIQDIKDLQSKVLDSASAIVEWVNTIEDLVPAAIDAARERYNLFTNQLDHNTTVLDTIKELYALQGVTYKTMDGFNKLQQVAQEKLEAQVANSVLQRQWYDEAKARYEEAQALFLTVKDDETNINYDIYKKQRDALLQEMNEAEEAYLSLAQNAMETAQEMYKEQLEKAVYDFDKIVSNNIGLDLLQEKYDHYIEEQSRYLDKVNEAYEVQAWNDKLQKDIDKTTNNAMKKKLKDLQDEIDMRREGNTLSKYDLEILEAKYKVLQAQIALEDAQNKKNKMQLVRDSNGNWNYQFTADPTEVENAQQDILNAENEWYNIAKDRVTEISGQIVDTWQECKQKIKDIYSDMTLTDEERTAAAEEIYKYYTKKIKYLEDEKNIALKDMNEAGNQELFHLAAVAGDEIADITGIKGEDIQKILKVTGENTNSLLMKDSEDIKNLLDSKGNEILGLIGKDSEVLKNIIEGNSEDLGIFENTYGEILDNMTSGTEDFEENLRNTLDDCEENYENLKDTIEYVADEAGVNIDDLIDKTEELSESTDTLRDAGIDAAEGLWEMIDAVQDATLYYADLAAQIWKTVEAMKELARQQASYVESKIPSNEELFTPVDTTPKPVVSPTPEPVVSEIIPPSDTPSETQKTIYDHSGIVNGSTADGYIDATTANPTWTKWYPTVASLTDQLTNAGAIVVHHSGGNGIAINYQSYDQFPFQIPGLINTYDTGGYTGEFEGAKLAYLHQKELVLNKDDTKNILDVVQITRDMFANIESILAGNVSQMFAGLAAKVFMPQIGAPISGQLEQTIHIDEVVFPQVTSSNEIKEAFATIANDAAQWSGLRKK